MGESKRQYRVETLGGSFSAAKDEEIEAVLNEWGEEGWLLISAYPIGDNKVRLIAHLPDEEGKKKTGWP
jgi:hypothetical protein